MERRLAAILAADIVGYSRLMGEDEEGTLGRLMEWRERTVNPAVRKHKGRVFKSMGDGLLAEFGSVVDAVRCGVEIQTSMSVHEGEAANRQRLQLRIGINLGDVIVEGDDIFGDGVNVATRLEGQAPHGGILASEVVHTQVSGKVGVTFVDAGEIRLKNIDRPLHVWRWDCGTVAPTARTPFSSAAPLATKPSIAVLPFSVMSNDPEQEFFADGLVEDILTTLSKLAGLSVIARNSSFVYKGRAVDVRQVARELGVRFVLEGSVRKVGSRIRIAVQLIDASTGVHVWADRFDRGIDDVFAVQDEITLMLATEMQVRLTEGEQARLRYTTAMNVAAWSLWIEGLNLYRGSINNLANHIPARLCWEKALALDPGSAPLNAMLGFMHFADARHGITGEPRDSAMAKAEAYIARALEIDPQNPDAYRAASGILLLKSRFEEAAAAARRAIQLGPSLPDVLSFASFVLASSGHPAEGIGHIQKAMALSPNHQAWYFGALGNALRLAGRADEAMTAFREYHARSPGYGLADIVMVQEQAGRSKDARETAMQLMAARPTFTVTSFLKTQLRSDVGQLAADVASLRAAGIPEE